MRFVRHVSIFIAVVFLLPALASLAAWSLQEHPQSWREANWSSSGLLPVASDDGAAAIYVLSARTGGLKGALSSHSWIVMKRRGAGEYERYDKVGWGNPVRRNGYPADAYWYSNMPEIVHEVHGEAAERLIPEFDAAIASYPYAMRGGYRIWPGPNSNSFVAYVLNAVPGFGGRLPSTAVGRDYAPGMGFIGLSPDGLDLRVTLGGLTGFTIGWASGLEFHLGGLVAGIDVRHPSLKIPGFGRIGLFPSVPTTSASAPST
ncbi:DUF3750 domain-containing protein [Aquamicrobium sp. LC103]|uniref:DUF3750 domain-containing protein n=1 Tax=Aquamicrobium sp. LC103 TaxID=1120658 RepID=UPI00063E94BE|nr:DUF3750 domain-containing protein [Aquamicrobium sp. LC103]TKT81198.1 DUF3750 domain-containing protein [Aquamicrobium sp. LC103]